MLENCVPKPNGFMSACSLPACLRAGGSGTELRARRKMKLSLVEEVAWVDGWSGKSPEETGFSGDQDDHERPRHSKDISR